MKPPFDDGLLKLVEEAERLDKECEESPEGEVPFKLRYEARGKLQTAVQIINVYNMAAQSSNCSEHMRVLHAGLLYRLGRYTVNCEERQEGVDQCQKALDVIAQGEVNASFDVDPVVTPLSVHTYITLLNYLGFVAESRGFSDEAKSRLHHAERAYKAYQDMYEHEKTPWDLNLVLRYLCGVQGELKERSELANPADDPAVFQREKLWQGLESQHTHTLYYLAQVYTNAQDKAKAAGYCEATLERQLKWREEFQPIDWSVNAITLSQYYIGCEPENFPEARRCLSAAEAVLAPELEALSPDLASQSPDSVEDPTPEQERAERLLQGQADLFRCWAKYGILLLESSKSWLLNPSQDEAEEETKMLKVEDIELTDKEPETKEAHLFGELDVSAVEHAFPAARITSFPVAKRVYQKVLCLLDSSRKFYGIDNRARDFAEIAQDESRLYSAMTVFYEKPPDVAAAADITCRLHKRRLDLLVKTLDGFNEQAYLAICRQLAFEIGEIANEMASLKTDAMNARNVDGQRVPTPHEVAKINMLCDTGIAYFGRFFDSYKTPEPERVMPEKVGEEEERALLISRFYVARLFAKKLSGDMKEKRIWTRASLECYRWIQDYITRNPDARQKIAAEYEAAKEMADLLPLKISRMDDAIMST